MPAHFSRRWRRLPCGHQIRHESFLAGPVLARDDGALLHRRVSAEGRFDFLQFDPKTTDFYLSIHPPQKFNAAVRQPACAVASAIQARPRLIAERMRNKFLRRQLRTIQIIPRQAVAAGVQFARNAHWRRLQMRVENVNLRVGDGAPDGNGPVRRQGRGDRLAAGERRVLRRSVTVDQLRVTELFQRARDVRR